MMVTKMSRKTKSGKDASLLSIPRKLLSAFSQRMSPPKGQSSIAYILEEDTIRGRDVLSIADFTPGELKLILDAAAGLKANKFDETQTLFAKGQTLAMLFEKPSLRTRFTFEAGMTQLGGHAVYLESRLGEREPIFDVAKNLDRWVDGIMARTFDHASLHALADNAVIPVINGLSDLEHPCQALADFQTIIEKKESLDGLKLVFIGDGNNVAHSLMLLAAKLGVDFVLACPEGYMPDAGIVQRSKDLAVESGCSVEVVHDPAGAVKDADVIYTDTWVSMGQEEERKQRAEAFKDYKVDSEMLALAQPDALVMHCLPAHRGEEVSSEVLDGPQSVIYDQAENRLHAQKAVISLVM